VTLALVLLKGVKSWQVLDLASLKAHVEVDNGSSEFLANQPLDFFGHRLCSLGSIPEEVKVCLLVFLDLDLKLPEHVTQLKILLLECSQLFNVDRLDSAWCHGSKVYNLLHLVAK